MMTFIKSFNVNLGKSSVGRDNNLDIIRFIAAIMVIVCHAFPLSYGINRGDFLFDFTKSQVSLGAVAVGIFFLYAGFLITKSMIRVQTTKKYFKARILRIFPALFFVVFLLTFIIGPIISRLSVTSYFSNSDTYKYLLNAILVITHNLPGVFAGNVYGQTVNGPLWTLPIEFMCYVLCFIAFKIGFVDKKKFLISIPLFIIGCISILFLEKFSLEIITIIRPIVLFYIGMAMYIYKDKIELNLNIAFLFTIAMIVLGYLGQSDIAMILLFPYVMFTLAYATKHKISNFGKYGEFSYGIYLWGWPIQQIIVSICGKGMNAYLNAIITIPIAFIMAVITYYVVEKPALKFK